MSVNKITEGEVVTLDAILEARDRRAARIIELQQALGCCIISFSLNIAGPVKRAGLTFKTFEAGKREILNQLIRGSLEILDYIYTDEKTGTEAMWAINADAHKLKTAMVSIEENHFIGRFFDIDVIDKDGMKISRQAIGQEERSCFICGEPGFACARSRAHSLEELTAFTLSLMAGYFENQHIKAISQCAVKALLYEVCITPKPGLVDRVNSGAHNDMDIFTFVDSACSLINYFEEITRIAIKNRELTPKDLLGKIRFAGMAAEDNMFEATKGINTHKGLIFSLGILCAAYGYLYESNSISTDKALELCATIALPALEGDFKNSKTSTTGEALYVQYKIQGVRGEAASGFNSVKQFALPVLDNCINAGLSLNDAGAIALLNLIANVEDTNIISRSSLEAKTEIQKNMKTLLEQESDAKTLIEKAIQLDSEFIQQNISPGGCADLLAITLMLYFMNKQGAE